MKYLKMNEQPVNAIWKKYKKTGQRRYRDILIGKYLYMVGPIAGVLKKKLPDCVDVGDLESSGFMGLLDALRNFDPEKGVKFQTYAQARIRGAMIDDLRKQDWVPRVVRIKEHKVKKAYEDAKNIVHRQPTPFEVARQLRMSIIRYNELERGASIWGITSFNAEMADGKEMFGMFEDKPAGEIAERAAIKDIVEYMKKYLNERQRVMLQLYFYDNLTMEDTAGIMKISPSRVSQVITRTINKLRYRFGRRKSEWLEDTKIN